MTKRLALLGIATLLLAVGSWLFFGRPGAGADPAGGTLPDENPSAAEGRVELTPLDPATVGESGVGFRSEVPTAAAGPGPKPSHVEQPAEGTAHIVGRLLLPTGAPAAGAEVLVHGWVGNSTREQKFGAPSHWPDVKAAADADGSFDVALVPPRAFQFTMKASMPGHAGLSWRWGELLPGSATDLGVQTFSPACRITGKVLGKDGEPTGVLWSVYADAAVGATGEGSNGSRVSALADPVTGAFELDGLPPGPVVLKGYSKKANWIDGPTVLASPDEVANADIVYGGPDLSSTISITTFCRPFHIFSTPEGLRIVARSSDGTEFEAERIPGSSQSFRVQGLPPGAYTVEASSPVHETWTKDGVRPGDSVRVQLRGGARVALTVLDGATGESVKPYRLRIGFNGTGYSPNVFTVLGRGKEPPAGGLFEGLIPWDVTLMVDAEGFAPFSLPLGEIKANTTTQAEARLVKGGRVEVVVVDGSGKPAAGAAVTLHPFFKGYDPEDVFSGPMDSAKSLALRAATVKLTAGDNGRVAFEALTPGPYGLLAKWGALDVRKDRVEVHDGARIQETLTLPQSGSLEGRLTGGPPGGFNGLRVRADSLVQSKSEMYFMTGPSEPGTSAVAPDGTFLVEALPVGAYRVELYLPSRMVPTSTSSSSSSSGRVVALGEVDVTAGAPTWATFDASAFVPATVTFTARRNGAPGAGLLLRIQGDQGGGWDGSVLSADGTVEFAPVFPGDWTVTVRSLSEDWVYTHPEVMRLAPGEAASMDLLFETAKGRLRVIDVETGEPAASRQVYANGHAGPKTDAEGWLDLELPVGPLTLDGKRPWPNPSSSVVTIDWGPSGPSLEEVTLTFRAN